MKLTMNCGVDTIAPQSKCLLAPSKREENAVARRINNPERSRQTQPEPDRSAGSAVRQRILETAIKLFAQKGFRGTTTKEIALAAAVNEVTIFRHFASKQELYAAILDAKSSGPRLTTYLADLEQLAQRRDDHALFRLVALRVLEQYRQDPDLLRLRLYSSLEGHELSKRYISRQVCPLFGFLRKYIVLRQAEGSFNHWDPDIAVQTFLGSVYNHAVCQYFHDTDFIRLSEEETASAFTSVFLDGMAAKARAKRNDKWNGR
jgi:AcrR family transcriptional regulator